MNISEQKDHNRKLSDFFSHFNTIIQEQGRFKTESYVFRGESKDYKETRLKSALARTRKIETTEYRQGHYQEEVNNLSIFKREAYPFIPKDNLPESELEWNILAQHYKFPTRLLDWSSNPLVALFFAVESNDDEDGAFFSVSECFIIDDLDDIDFKRSTFKKYSKNQFAKDIESCKENGSGIPSWIEYALFIRPKYTDNRYLNQSTVLMLPKEPLDNKIIESDSIECLKIPHTIKSDLRRYLRAIGITHSFIYPGLEGAAKTAESKINEEPIKVDFSLFTPKI